MSDPDSYWVGTKETCDNDRISELFTIPQHEQRSPEWFAQRRQMLTSSNAGAVLGLEKYRSPYQILKHYCESPKPFTSSAATRHGVYWEDPAIEYYCAAMNYRNYNFGLLPFMWKQRDDVILDKNGKKIDLSFLGGSVDGLVQDLNDPQGEPIMIEVKCPYKREIKFGKVPEHYFPQVQLNMFITNTHVSDFIEYEPSGLGRSKHKIMNIVRCYRDKHWLNENVPKLREFWDEVEHYRKIGIENHPKFRAPRVKNS